VFLHNFTALITSYFVMRKIRKYRMSFFSFILFFIMFSVKSFSQSKKEQISTLQLRIDSLYAVLQETRIQLNDSQNQLKDKISSSSETEARLNSELSAKGKSLQELSDKNAKLNAQLTILNDSLVIVNSRAKDFSSQISSLKAESDRLKADLEKQTNTVSNSTTSKESLWCNLSDVNGVYAIQNPIIWDFPQVVTVKIDTKSITFNAFKQMRTYEYGMKVIDGTIHLIFGDVSEDSGDYLGGGEISFTVEGVKLSVYTGTEAEIEQVYFKALNK
jgi:predicted nuclease with TOPRIM domain